MDFVPASGYEFLATSCPGFVGVTAAMNTQGMGIGNDMVPTTDCNPAKLGMGTLLTCRYVIQYTNTITAATNFIQNSTRGCSWIYGIGCGRSGNMGGCAVETSASYCNVRNIDYAYQWYQIFPPNQIENSPNLITWTNHYLYYGMSTLAGSYATQDSLNRYGNLTNLAVSMLGTLNLQSGTGQALINYLHPGGPTGYYGNDTTQTVKASITCWDLTTLQASALYGHYNDAWVNFTL
jgi:hypothetical protein